MPQSKIQFGGLEDGTAGMTLLEINTATNNSSVVFNTIPKIFNRLHIVFETVTFNTDDTLLLMQFDYGAGMITTGYHSFVRTAEDTSAFNNDVGATTSMQLAGDTTATWGIGNLTNEGISGGNIDIFDAQNFGAYTTYRSNIIYTNNANFESRAWGEQQTNGAIEGIGIGPPSGTFSGSFKLYGII